MDRGHAYLQEGGTLEADDDCWVVIVTGAFAFTNITQTKMLGFGISLAIIADAVLVRFTLLPAIMVYLGRANWWWPQFEWAKKLGGRPGAPVDEGDAVDDPDA